MGQQRQMLEAARKARARRRSWPKLNWRDWPGMAKAAAWWGRLSRRGRAGILAGAALVVAGSVTLGVVLSLPPAPRARQYLAFTACLLTDAHGLNGQPAATAWAGPPQCKELLERWQGSGVGFWNPGRLPESALV
jgi:hypothetical protein